MGRVYCRQKDNAEAIRTHTLAFNHAKKPDTRLDMTQSLVGLAQAYLAMGNAKSAIPYFKDSIEAGTRQPSK